MQKKKIYFYWFCFNGVLSIHSHVIMSEQEMCSVKVCERWPRVGYINRSLEKQIGVKFKPELSLISDIWDINIWKRKHKQYQSNHTERSVWGFMFTQSPQSWTWTWGPAFASLMGFPFMPDSLALLVLHSSFASSLGCLKAASHCAQRFGNDTVAHAVTEQYRSKEDHTFFFK